METVSLQNLQFAQSNTDFWVLQNIRKEVKGKKKL